MSKTPRSRDDFRPAEIADLFANAVALHQTGRLQEAEQHYRQILARDPGHADSLHLLGVLAHQVGRNELAVELIGKALAVDDRIPDFHYNIGLAHGALGRFEQAAAHNRRAIELDPNHAQAHINLGNALKAQGRWDEALAFYQRAVAIRPSPEGHFNTANALAELGRLDDAIAHYRHALTLRPDYAEAYNNLGLAQTARGALSEAASSFRRALALKPGLLDAAGLAHVLIGLGDLDNALRTTKRLHDAGETAETRALFYLCLRDARAAPFAPAYRNEIIRALSEPWGNSRYLSAVTVNVLKADSSIGPIVERAQHGPISAEDVSVLARDELLRAGLESTQFGDIAVERLLSELRKSLLGRARSHSGDALGLACSLARQCFINDYVFACSAEEAGQVAALGEDMAAALASGQIIEPAILAIVACYQPLHALPNADRLLAREWPAAVSALLTRQIAEPREEGRIRDAMPRLTGIRDAVSQAVRQQYEQNPYPRWTKSAAVFKAQALDAFLARRFPLAPRAALAKPQLDYLIAGCGTGQQVTGAVQTISGIAMTAVDLSLASLAYAKRMTDKMSMPVSYGQADILELGGLGRTFDVVDVAGVLHHMAEPLSGWRVLVSLVRPGGFMRVALYSRLARRHIAAAQRLVAAQGWPATPDGIRAARQAICALPAEAPERRVMAIPDFFSLSECRDLLFHVQEHTFDLPAIGAFLSENKLSFLGFEVDPAAAHRYAQRFPEDAARTNLDHWHAFEQENADTFIGMYQFWMQKRPGAPVS
jgi:tetratricopeptide (TPR) repeat protein/2-polyprenyl-3-methyl-5-hydroxy-6-metoxy-1,4-benzoquinol methylase